MIDPRIGKVLAFVQAHPGCTKLDAARHIGGLYGYAAVETAIMLGVIIAQRQPSGRYRLWGSEPAPPEMSDSERAARWAQATGATNAEAAKRYGIKQQSVSEVRRRLFPGYPHAKRGRKTNVDAHQTIARMVREGKTLQEIAEVTGLTSSHIRTVAREANLRASTKPGRREAYEAAIADVAAGTPLPIAAARAGVAYGWLATLCRRRGIYASRSSRHTGQARAAADLVEQGLSVSEASQRMACAPTTTSAVLQRRRAKSTAVHDLGR